MSVAINRRYEHSHSQQDLLHLLREFRQVMQEFIKRDVTDIPDTLGHSQSIRNRIKSSQLSSDPLLDPDEQTFAFSDIVHQVPVGNFDCPQNTIHLLKSCRTPTTEGKSCRWPVQTGRATAR